MYSDLFLLRKLLVCRSHVNRSLGVIKMHRFKRNSRKCMGSLLGGLSPLLVWEFRPLLTTSCLVKGLVRKTNTLLQKTTLPS